MNDELMGAAEVAELLGVTRQRVNQLATDAPDFPEPIAVLQAGRIWRSKDIEAWRERHSR